MRASLRNLTSRLLLSLMLLTFLSPSFGWQMVAGHELLEHSKVGMEEGHHDHHHDELFADRPVPHDHEHEDAHTMAGHVLSHMPATTFYASLPRYTPHQPVMRGAEPPLDLPSSFPDQPYRPPQTLLV